MKFRGPAAWECSAAYSCADVLAPFPIRCIYAMLTKDGCAMYGMRAKSKPPAILTETLLWGVCFNPHLSGTTAEAPVHLTPFPLLSRGKDPARAGVTLTPTSK